MKIHPTAEEWMAFVYAEDVPSEHARLNGHLRACAECRRKVAAWRGGMRSLDAWAMPERVRSWTPSRILRRAIPAAAAAAVLLGAGLVLGRATSSPPDPGRLQASLRSYVDDRLGAAHTEMARVLEERQTEMAQRLQAAAASTASEEARDVLTQYARAIAEQRETDHQAYVAAFRQLDERRQTDVTALREDLQTVAVNADDELTRTQEQLLQLASAAKPESP